MESVIFYLLCFLIEAVITLEYASELFIAKKSVQLRLTVLVFLYCILFAISLLDMKWLNMGLYFIVNVIFFLTQYKIQPLSAFFHSAILSAVMGMCELSVYSIIERFVPHFFSQVNDFHNTILFIVFSKVLFFSIIYILMHFFKSRKKCSLQQQKSSLLLLIIPLTTIFIMLTLLNLSEDFILTPALNWMISLSSIFLLITNLLVFGINQYTQQKEAEYTEMQLLLQRENDFTEYYKMILCESENQSILIHDIKKHLQSIKLLLEKRDYEKVYSYVHQLLHSSALRENARICDHELLNAILSRYKHQCDEHSISFHADIRTGVMEFLCENDLTALFCNLLDNSFESVCNIQEPFIEINVQKREKTPFVVVSVINSCLIDPFNNSDGTLKTKKMDKTKHGFGLKSIYKTVEKYQGDMQMYYNKETTSFHTVITLKQF